jgi:hypothetical protein
VIDSNHHAAREVHEDEKSNLGIRISKFLLRELSVIPVKQKFSALVVR